MGVIVDRRAGMADEKHASFGLRYLNKRVLGVIASDALREMLVGLVEF
jgi:hypothetical protein